MAIITSLHHLPVLLACFVFVARALQDLSLNRLLPASTVLALRSEPNGPLPSFWHLLFIRGRYNYKHSNCCLHNSLFQRQEVLPGECVFVDSLWLCLWAGISVRVFWTFPSPSPLHPLHTSLAHQLERLTVSEEPTENLPTSSTWEASTQREGNLSVTENKCFET